MSRSSLRSFGLRTAFVFGAALVAGCGTDPTPAPSPSGPGTPNDPGLPGDPPVDPQSRPPAATPGTCSIAPPGAEASWEVSAEVTEDTARSVAATDASLFLFDSKVVRRSVDDGVTWVTLDSVPATYVRAMAAAGSDLFLSGYQNGVGNSVWRSTDEGATWTLAEGIGDTIVDHMRNDGGIVTAATFVWSAADEQFQAVAVPPELFLDRLATDGETYLGATYGGVFYSPDGTTWTHIETLTDIFYPRMALAGSVAVAIDSQGGLARSEDGGQTFAPVAFDVIENGTAIDVDIVGGAVLVATTAGVFRSTDGGVSFALVQPIALPALDAFFGTAQLLASFGDAVAVSGAEIFTSADGGVTWSDTPPILDATPWSVGATTNTLLASTIDMKVHGTQDGNTWFDIESQGYAVGATATEGDVSFLLMVQATPGSIAYFPDGELVRTVDGGNNFEFIARPPQSYMTTFNTVALHDGVLLFGSSSTVTSGNKAPGLTDGGGIWRSLDDGQTWSKATAGLPIAGYDDYGKALHPAIAALHGHGGQFFASLEEGGLFRSDDQGATWVESDAGLPHGELGAGLTVDFFASVAGRVVGASRDPEGVLAVWSEGAQTWTPAAVEGLPEGFAVSSLVAHGGYLFAGIAGEGGADPGVYWSNDAGESWTSADLPRTALSLAVWRDTLFVGTDRSALWSLDLGACEAP